ncbi:hypothetical protein K431DRAFT_288068 [Polychaeton citri CBS 116435]|uniref:Zn(2)-C6 fungal-type domain-containing protein n=1 Tax=Polychaeton citri CBS 116435 TaxID=1314669 RepID=A0A9P4UMJ6_9PEZI|nr:hypothetical protein K431DRAFT_288068 [Polychaeton citri CBS 116435]
MSAYGDNANTTDDEVHTASPEHHPHTGLSGDPHHIKLACQACQRKKIKCDRTFPCGQCSRSGLHCVPSTRKPRARHAVKRGVDSELRSRIAKLEGLVETLSSDVATGNGSSKSEAGGANASTSALAWSSQAGESPIERPQRQGSLDDSSPAATKYVASDFWSTLSNEVQAIKDVLDDEPHASDGEASHQEDHPPPSNLHSMGGASTNAQDYDLIICPPGLIYLMPGALSEPTPSMSLDLFNVFCENVELIFKVFHAPSLRAFLVRNEPYLGNSPDAPCNRALKACIWFSALISISDLECQQRYGLPRAQLLQQYRKLADVMLAQADLINTTEIATMQGFIMYLATARLVDVSRRVWTLSALLVRIAKAMNLHLEESSGESVFMTELKRRFWHQLQVFDAYCAIDRGSEPLVTLSSHSRSAPCNVNDSDFDESTTTPLTDRSNQLTDMTFARLIQDAAIIVQRFNTNEDKPTSDTWQHRQDIASQFARDIQEKHLQYCDPDIPLQRFILVAGKSIMASMMLRAIRPMQKHVSSVPPPVNSPYVLELAVNNLRCSENLYTLQGAKRWQWLVWVQWHAIAVTLAGLCSIRDTPLATEAWELVDRAMVRYERHVADTKNGMLWKPISRLYRKASAFRESGQRAQQTPDSQQGQSQSPLTSSIHVSQQDSPFGITNPTNGARVPSWNLLNSIPVSSMAPPPSTIPDTTAVSASGVNFDVSHQYPFDTTTAASIPDVSAPSGGSGGGMNMPITDHSWWDWEKIMRDLDEINVGEMNWMPA